MARLRPRLAPRCPIMANPSQLPARIGSACAFWADNPTVARRDDGRCGLVPGSNLFRDPAKRRR